MNFTIIYILAFWALDQGTKYWVLHQLIPGHAVPVVPNCNLLLSFNPGIAFSMLEHARVLLSIVSSMLIVVLWVWLLRTPKDERTTQVALAAMIGGAIGNLNDRLVYGHVVDFIQLYWREWAWPVFNVADTLICIGACFLMLGMWRQKPY